MTILCGLLLSYSIYLLVQYFDSDYNTKTTYTLEYNTNYTYPWFRYEWESGDSFNKSLIDEFIWCSVTLNFNDNVTSYIYLLPDHNDSKIQNMSQYFDEKKIRILPIPINTINTVWNFDTSYVYQLIKDKKEDELLIIYGMANVTSPTTNGSAGSESVSNSTGVFSGADGVIFFIPPTHNDNSWDHQFEILHTCMKNKNSISNVVDNWMNSLVISFDGGYIDIILGYVYNLGKIYSNSEGTIMPARYVCNYIFEWYQKNNNIDDTEANHYEYTSGGTFYYSDTAMTDYLHMHHSEWDTYMQPRDWHMYMPARIILLPQPNGVRHKFVIQFLMQWTDIISSIGGMYSAITAVLTPLFLYIIWGYQSKIVQIKRADPNATVDYIETQKFESLMKQYGFDMLEKKYLMAPNDV